MSTDSIAWEGGVLNCCTWNVAKKVEESAINKILPIYKLGDLLLVILLEDFQGKQIKDTVCLKISLNSREYNEPWSMAKHLKHGDGFYDVSSKDEVDDIRMKLSATFTAEDISNIYNKLKFPTAEAIASLVSTPDRLLKM